MTSASPATYGLLGMLSVRSWTGYELTQQVRRSLRFVWPSSEGHLYREQRRLVDLGWATVEEESAGQRSRKRYTITSAGRAALRRWLTTQPEEPHFQIEGVLRMFFADQGSAADLASAMRSTRHLARAMLDEMVGFVDEYLDDGGPLWMLEADVGGRSSGRRQYRGRTMYPERLHVVALAIDVTTQLLDTLDRFLAEAQREVANWPNPAHPSLTPATRARLEAIRARAARPAGQDRADHGHAGAG
jgi:PadR family transcriptional regulator, regulatory protein AphA